MSFVLWDEYRNEWSLVAPANEPLALLPVVAGFGTSNPEFPWESVTACDPISVPVVLVNLAFPPLYLPFHTMVTLMGLVDGVARAAHPPPVPVVLPVIFPCWIVSVVPPGRPLTEQPDNLPLMVTLVPPVVSLAGGLKPTLTLTP